MNKYLFTACWLLFGFISFAQTNKIINDPNAEKRNVQSFHAIHVSQGIDLYLSQGDEAVAVSASDLDLRNRIKVEVENGILQIFMDNKTTHWHWGNKKLRAYVSFKTLDNLEASGGSDLFTEGAIKIEKLHISLSGGSDLKATVDIHDLSIHQSGGSDIKIEGVAINLTISASGGSDFSGYDLLTDNCHIEASGGSDMHITVNKELDVNASGGSDVYYKGAAVIKSMHSSGSSSISKKN
ncbi:MAG: DUF2807 domain-containing protein [Bacteroidetes bacterium]|nr:DUF2807 domain-containing protein [Bacteroidota bacterium]